jgi:VIT1/CCC1 family predicted Fe2+/Mn2+ transporter
MRAPRHPERHFAGSDAVRDLILGMSDGLTTPFALAAGLAGAATSNILVVIGGFAEIAAGSISMGLGGYLAAQSQAETYRNELAREMRETEVMPGEERAEVWRIFRGYGLRGAALEQATNAVTAERDAWVRFMMREELGLEEPAPRAALWSAARIAIAYVVGGLIPLAPYLLALPVHTALLASTAVTGLALASFGAVKARYTGARPVRAALQTLTIGGRTPAVPTRLSTVALTGTAGEQGSSRSADSASRKRCDAFRASPSDTASQPLAMAAVDRVVTSTHGIALAERATRDPARD